MEFRPGFNVIVGRNNVGKTALVESLSLRFHNKPHQSLITLPYPGAVPEHISRVQINFEIGRDELLKILANRLPVFYVPRGNRLSGNVSQSFMQALTEPIVLICSYEPDRSFVSSNINGLYDSVGTQLGVTIAAYTFMIDRPSMEVKVTHDHANADLASTIAYQVSNILRDRIYVFRAERLNVAQAAIAANSELLPDASNLAQVLHYLSNTNPYRYNKLIQFINAIFPEIKYISAPPVTNDPGITRIQLWTIDPNTEREDLAIPLQESGTGIGQVLAILYVVLTSNDPRTIIIDEPQSFLHPGAIRKLIDILRQDYSQHQYILTTHSPTVVTSAYPQSIILVRREEAQSVTEVVDVAETQRLRLFLLEIGARLADVFGADNILWVEGATEEQCFPLILEKIAMKPLMGTTIVGVKHTGDFQGKHKQLVLDVYHRLSSARGLLPSAIGFIFDREGLSEQDREDLKRQSKGSVRFLSRRMYENYLLHSGAIASLMNSMEGFRDRPIEPQEIEDWINTNGWDRKYGLANVSKQAQHTTEWYNNVDGSKILKDLFIGFSETRVAYDNKPEYGQALTLWLIEHDPDSLKEIAGLLVGIVEGD